jgi:hypothetical protein
MTTPATVPSVLDVDVPHCAGITASGGSCGSPTEMLRTDPETGESWCFAHDPEKEQERRLATTRGGLTTKLRSQRGLDPDDLGPLETPLDARRWSAVIASAAACGRITPAQANAASRAVDGFLKARDQHIKETELADLKRDLERLKQATTTRTGDRFD